MLIYRRAFKHPRNRRFLSIFTSRTPLQRKSIGSLPDSEQQLLFGNRYDRKQGSDERSTTRATARASSTPITPAELQSGVEEIRGLHPGKCDRYSVTLIGTVLRKCGTAKDVEKGLAVHLEIKRIGLLGNVFLGNLLINMYGKCGDVSSARVVFDAMTERNKYTWSIMVAAYAQNGHSNSALDMYERMVAGGEEVDDVLLATVIGVCASIGDLESGVRIHERVRGSNLIVETALINMYGKCRVTDRAKLVFDRMPEKDVIAWNAMLAAYAQSGHLARQTLELHREMTRDRSLKPDAFTYSSVISACASLGDVEEGKRLHLTILKSGLKPDVTLDNTLLNMYAKCGCLPEARRVFDNMKRKSTITWSSMVSAYAQNGHHREALELYKQMDMSPVKPNCITYSNALSACAGLGELSQGRAIHERVVKENWHTAAVISSALIHMYAKCSCMEDARGVFDGLGHKDLVCGNTMIAAYAQFGHLEQAVEVYREMVQHGTPPSGITLIGLVIGASHAGRVEDGRAYFVDFVDHHEEVSVLWEHYMCLIDLLGRSGWLRDAEELVNCMPYEPCVTGWITLLSACRMHGDVDRAERSAEKVYELEPEEGAHPKLILNLYKECGKKWDIMNLLRYR